MEEKTYNVLWFDDKPKDGFILNASLSGIIIKNALNLKDGLILLEKPEKWDALILDANFKRHSDELETLILSDTIHDVVLKCGPNKPWFVLTAGDYKGIEAIMHIIPQTQWEKEFNTKKFYNKVGDDEEELFDDIKKVVNNMNTPEWLLRNEHKEIFSLFQSTRKNPSILDEDSESDLTRILFAYNNPKESINPDHFNTIRRFVAGDIMKVLGEIGVIPVSISELNSKKFHIGNKKFKDYIPIYVQQAFYSLIDVCQDGSHSGHESTQGKIPPVVEKSIKSGNAPYLLKSIVLDLLTVLWWLKDFAKERDKEVNELIFSSEEIPSQTKEPTKFVLKINSQK